MSIEIRQQTAKCLEDYARVSIAFRSSTRLRVLWLDGGLGGIDLREEPLSPPFEKDFDRQPGQAPADWPRRWPVERWGFFGAFADGARIGGAAVAHDTPGICVLQRRELACLWDLRVSPASRGRGAGKLLFAAAVAWARQAGDRVLEVESQNNNVAACRFYAGRGCQLRGALPTPRPDDPLEVQLLWYLDLNSRVEEDRHDAV